MKYYAHIGKESSSMTNGGESGKASLDDVKALFAVMVLHVGAVHINPW